MADISTKPYLIRAIHEWCEDSGYRPYIAVVVDDRTQVPSEFVRNGEIVLNVSAQATYRLRIGNDFIDFEARFSGAVRSVSIPIENVSAIYAQETGHGMAFDVVRAQPSKPAPAPAPAAVVTRGAPAGSASSPPSRSPAAKPRLVPKEQDAPVDRGESVERAELPVPAAVVEPPPRPESAAPAARKPRSSKRRAQPVETVASDTGKAPEVVSLPPPDSPPAAAIEPPRPDEPPPDGPSKPRRAHLKRVK